MCVLNVSMVGSFLEWFLPSSSYQKMKTGGGGGGWPKEGGGEWVGGMSYHPYIPYFTRVSIYYLF